MSQQTFQIAGMTCQNCKHSVEKHISELPAVKDVEVNLSSGQVHIEAAKTIKREELLAVLPPKYSLSPTDKETVLYTTESKFKQLRPLFLILTYISVAAVMMHWQAWQSTAFMADFMGLFFIVFGFFKILDISGFAESFAMYDPLAKRFPLYARIYPLLETVLGIMFLTRSYLFIAVAVSLAILSITSWGVLQTLLNKRKIRCACLGSVLNLPMTEATLIENAIMLTMGVVMLVML